jgi:hypothetical protein
MDNLQYIRDAIKQYGNTTQVKVIRWEINPATGAQDTPFEVTVNAKIALRELQKPINKRSYSWTRIRPMGESLVGVRHRQIDQNSLSDPELLSQLKAELKAQLIAEMEAEKEVEPTIIEEVKPKRKKKSEESIDEVALNSLDSPDLRIDDLPL